MKASEIFEANDGSLNGFLDVQSLAKLLPNINNMANFANAMNKLRIGQGADMTIPEKMQLAAAFVSLVELPMAQKTIVMDKLMDITASTQAPNQQTSQTNQTQGQPANSSQTPVA